MAVRRAAASLAVACALAGCGTAGSTSSSAVTVSGNVLSIWISMPPHATAAEQAVVQAERLAYAAHSGEVSRFHLRLEVARNAELSANARQAIQDKSAIAYLGELAPGSSEDTVGITNAVDLLQVSPTDTALELTQATSAVPGAPGRYYEARSTYGRTFARVVPNSAAEATAQVAEMRKLGVSSLYIADDGSDYGKAIAAAVRKDAAGASITVTSSASGAGAEFYGSGDPAAAGRALASAGPTTIFGPSALDEAAVASALASSGKKVYVSVPSPAPGAQPEASSVQALQSPQARFGYEAMSAVLSVLQQAGAKANDRATVVQDFNRIANRSSILGTYSIRAGDTTLTSFSFDRLSGGAFTPVKR